MRILVMPLFGTAFSRPLCVFQVPFKANLIFKAVLYIHVLFKPVRTLPLVKSV